MAALFPASGFAKGDLDRLELAGNVRTVVTKHAQLKTTHQFDQKGLLSSLELAPINEAGSARYVYLRDEAGHLLEQQTSEPDGTILYRKLFRYSVDEQGRQSAEVAATEKGALAHVVFSQYDSRGLLAEEIMVTGQGIAEKSLYDVRGRSRLPCSVFSGVPRARGDAFLRAVRAAEGKPILRNRRRLMRKDLYRYDRAGNRMEQLSEFYRHSHLRKSVTTFESDHAGNWIRETIQQWSEKNGSVILTETVVGRERMITYC